MSNRVVIQEGYSMPFAGHRRRRKSHRRGRFSSAAKRQQNKMKVCAGKWRRSGKRGKYTSFMKSCLNK